MAQKPKCGSFFECENQEKHPEAFFVYHCGNCLACINLKDEKNLSLSQKVAETPKTYPNWFLTQMSMDFSKYKNSEEEISFIKKPCTPARPCYGKSGSAGCDIKKPCLGFY